MVEPFLRVLQGLVEPFQGRLAAQGLLVREAVVARQVLEGVLYAERPDGAHRAHVVFAVLLVQVIDDAVATGHVEVEVDVGKAVQPPFVEEAREDQAAPHRVNFGNAGCPAEYGGGARPAPRPDLHAVLLRPARVVRDDQEVVRQTVVNDDRELVLRHVLQVRHEPRLVAAPVLDLVGVVVGQHLAPTGLLEQPLRREVLQVLPAVVPSLRQGELRNLVGAVEVVFLDHREEVVYAVEAALQVLVADVGEALAHLGLVHHVVVLLHVHVRLVVMLAHVAAEHDVLQVAVLRTDVVAVDCVDRADAVPLREVEQPHVDAALLRLAVRVNLDEELVEDGPEPLGELQRHLLVVGLRGPRQGTGEARGAAYNALAALSQVLPRRVGIRVLPFLVQPSLRRDVPEVVKPLQVARPKGQVEALLVRVVVHAVLQVQLASEYGHDAVALRRLEHGVMAHAMAVVGYRLITAPDLDRAPAHVLRVGEAV